MCNLGKNVQVNCYLHARPALVFFVFWSFLLTDNKEDFMMAAAKVV